MVSVTQLVWRFQSAKAAEQPWHWVLDLLERFALSWNKINDLIRGDAASRDLWFSWRQIAMIHSSMTQASDEFINFIKTFTATLTFQSWRALLRVCRVSCNVHLSFINFATQSCQEISENKLYLRFDDTEFVCFWYHSHCKLRSTSFKIYSKAIWFEHAFQIISFVGTNGNDHHFQTAAIIFLENNFPLCLLMSIVRYKFCWLSHGKTRNVNKQIELFAL